MGDQNASAANQPSWRILILDVDPITLITLEQVLEEAGFDTATTWSIHEMFLWLENKRFDLIVVGDHPPEIDAYAILRRLETMRRHVPCMVMRAGRVLPNVPKLNEPVTSVSGCAGTEILQQARQYLRELHLQTKRDPSSKAPKHSMNDQWASIQLKSL
ncbi:MAG: hypothetical protein WCC87_11685 [Candidatus Korobacteraceae bacterium]